MEKETIIKLGLCSAIEDTTGIDMYNVMEAVCEGDKSDDDAFDKWQESLDNEHNEKN